MKQFYFVFSSFLYSLLQYNHLLCNYIVLVDEYLTQKDIIGAFFIILGCLVDQLPENAFLAYLKSCTRWPITMYTYMRASCVYDNNENIDEIESILTLTSTTSDINIVINDDDEEKMRKNLFMN